MTPESLELDAEELFAVDPIQFCKTRLMFEAVNTGTTAQTWYVLGRVYRDCEMYEEAYDAYHQAIQRDARNPTYWVSLGNLHYVTNRPTDALEAYTRAKKINPNIWEVHCALGCLHESSLKSPYEEAVKAYRTALSLVPDIPGVKQAINQRVTILEEHLTSGLPMAFAVPLPLYEVHLTKYAPPSHRKVGSPSFWKWPRMEKKGKKKKGERSAQSDAPSESAPERIATAQAPPTRQRYEQLAPCHPEGSSKAIWEAVVRHHQMSASAGSLSVTATSDVDSQGPTDEVRSQSLP